MLTLLDANDNGFVLNVMHSREGCYNYIKEIVKGESYVELSSEETESLEKAIFQEAYALKDIVDVKKSRRYEEKKQMLDIKFFKSKPRYCKTEY